MKKTLRKPENWQDFESLCKKLWGEIWQIPDEIKKNGRLGQAQSGVDVYGIPNAKDNYFGIQAKGKDDYSKAKLEESEIENEITKAKTFKPTLSEFIIATTANKDAKIEEFVRIKDLESRKNNGFKILLFCWEDIADLIEENRETFNWYVNEINFREKFDVAVTFDNETDGIQIKSKFQRNIKRFQERTHMSSFLDKHPHLIITNTNFFNPFESNKINHSWNKIKFKIKNIGSMVLEDWKIIFFFDENCRSIDDDFSLPLFMANEIKANVIQNRTTYSNDKNKILKYLPSGKSPMIQKDYKIVTGFIKTFPKNCTITVRWELLARNFSKEGILKINSTPEFFDKFDTVWVDNEEDVKKDEFISVEDYITQKK